MATVYSDQQTLRNSLEAGTGYSLTDGMISTNGRVHATFFSYTTAAVASGTVIELCTLPKGARILRGSIVTAASLGGSTTLSIGTDVALVDEAGTALTAAGVANLLAATATTGATNTPFAATRALGYLGLTTAATKLNAVTGGATLTAAVFVTGHVEYLWN